MARHLRVVALAAVVIILSQAGYSFSAAQDSQQSFRVERADLDLGTVVAGTTATATFVFHNDGPADVRIVRAKPS
jgi:hypothetical protein